MRLFWWEITKREAAQPALAPAPVFADITGDTVVIDGDSWTVTQGTEQLIAVRIERGSGPWGAVRVDLGALDRADLLVRGDRRWALKGREEARHA